MKAETEKRQQSKLTIYFSKDDTLEKICGAYDGYVQKYDGLACSRNRFIANLLVAGIRHFAKDNSIAWDLA